MSDTSTITASLLNRLGIPRALERHPVWACPTEDELSLLFPDQKQAIEWLRQRHEYIERQHHDPLRYGWESPGFIRAREALDELRKDVPRGVIILLIQGGNRPGKSEFCAKKVMETLTGGAKRGAWCFQQSEKISRETQQRYMHRYLPPEWRPCGESRGLKRGGITNVRYSLATGFSNNTFSLPNSSTCDFKFYESDITSLQGSAQDIIWFDELVPAEWVEDAQFRLIDRNGIMLVSFTSLEGYSDTVAAFADGAVKVKDMKAELLPIRDESGAVVDYESVPLIMSCVEKKKRIIFMPTQENFYGSYDVMVSTLAGASRDVILTRAYGVAEKKKGAKFTNWDDAIHILHEDGRKRMLQAASQLTWYHIYDPAGGRNPFMQWWAVTALGQWVLMREWPQPGDYIPGIGAEKGVWATSGGSDDGKAGPAQPSYKFGPADFSREIHRVECELGAMAGLAKIEPFARYMDSRAASAPNATSSGSITLVELFEDLGRDEDTGIELALDFEKASGRQTASDGLNWIDFIQAKLVPDKGTGFAPLMISHTCRNTIFALQTWTGEDGPKGATKDPVDCTKYFCLSDATYIPPVEDRPQKGTVWGGYKR